MNSRGTPYRDPDLRAIRFSRHIQVPCSHIKNCAFFREGKLHVWLEKSEKNILLYYTIHMIDVKSTRQVQVINSVKEGRSATDHDEVFHKVHAFASLPFPFHLLRQ